MKKLLLVLTAVLTLGAVSCKKVEKLTEFTFYIQSRYDFQFPAVPFAGPLPTIPFQTSSNSVTEFKNANTTADLVKDVKLERAALTITSPNGANFDFLQNIYIYISTDANDRVLLASLDPVPTGQTMIELQPSGNKLDKYLKSDTYILSVDSRFRSPLAQNTNISLDYKFKVVADPIR